MDWNDRRPAEPTEATLALMGKVREGRRGAKPQLVTSPLQPDSLSERVRAGRGLVWESHRVKRGQRRRLLEHFLIS